MLVHFDQDHPSSSETHSGSLHIAAVGTDHSLTLYCIAITSCYVTSINKVCFIHVVVYNKTHVRVYRLPKVQDQNLAVCFKYVIKNTFIVLVYIIKDNL